MGAMNGYNTGLRAREALERLKLGNAAYVNGQHASSGRASTGCGRKSSQKALLPLPPSCAGRMWW